MGFLDSYLVYNKPRSISVDIWQVALVYRIFQIMIYLYVLLYMYFYEAGWSYSEIPIGSFNAWGSADTTKFGEKRPSEIEEDKAERKSAIKNLIRTTTGLGM